MKISIPLLSILSTVILTSQAQSSLVYSGSISTSDGTLIGTEAWATDASVSWIVSENLDGSWLYSYEFDVASKDISHLIIEVCDTFGSEDILVFEDVAEELELPNIDLYGPGRNGKSNPGIPEDIYGLKLDTTEDTTFVSFLFWSKNAPTWADVYLKDGKQGGNEVYAFNSGFSLTDPTAPISDGSVDGHILAPGCTVIPEPNAALLGVFGVLGLLCRRR